MPGKASENVEPVAGFDSVKNHTLTLDTELAGYVVSYVEYPDELSDPDIIKTVLDNGRDGGLAASKGELTSEKEIKLDGNFGRESVVKLPGGFLTTTRSYWIKRRYFQIVFVEVPKASDTPEIRKLRQEAGTKFLDSFKLKAETGKS
jgi:hypothetical protein